MYITPAILSENAEDAKKKLFHPELKNVAPLFHIDVLDGSMFDTSCWADPEILGTWKNLPDVEIHLMVHDPEAHAIHWKRHVPSLVNVIFHAEAKKSTPKLPEQLHAMKVSTTLAINPETPVEIVRSFQKIDELLIMGIHPGASGQTFLGETILAKIRRAKALYRDLPLAVDGGVQNENIQSLVQAGIERVIVASALWRNENPKEGLEELARCAIITL